MDILRNNNGGFVHKTKYDAKYFIAKFEKIPEEKWCRGTFSNIFNGILQHCALGHCGLSKSYFSHYRAKGEEKGRALIKLFHKNGLEVSYINDGIKNTYCSDIAKDLGDTPKERIVNALCLIDNKLGKVE